MLCLRNRKVVVRHAHPFNIAAMTSRTGLEAEAINRLTDGVRPLAVRAILVQCLAGELAPSAAISKLLTVENPATVRAAIDYVTHRAATSSRASDMLVRDRVDELTQIFVETVAGLADISSTTKRPGPERVSPPREFVDRDEFRIAE